MKNQEIKIVKCHKSFVDMLENFKERFIQKNNQKVSNPEMTKLISVAVDFEDIDFIGQLKERKRKKVKRYKGDGVLMFRRD